MFAIVGGSIVGPTLALALQNAGRDDVHVFEAARDSLAQGGGTIGLLPDAVESLVRLGIPTNEYAKMSNWIVGPDIFRSLFSGQNTTVPLLHRALRSRVHNFHGGMRVVGLRGMTLLFKDGTTVDADAIVFADGRKSIGREILDPGRPLKYMGYVAYRGIIEADQDGPTDNERHPLNPGEFNLFPWPPHGADWNLLLNTTVRRYVDLFDADPVVKTFVFPDRFPPRAREAVNLIADQRLMPLHARLVHRTVTRMAAPIVTTNPPSQMVWSIGRRHAILIGDALAPLDPHTASGASSGIVQAATLPAALRNLRALDTWQSNHLFDTAEKLSLGKRLASFAGLGMER